jgi:alpha-L-fucosidase 2
MSRLTSSIDESHVRRGHVKSGPACRTERTLRALFVIAVAAISIDGFCDSRATTADSRETRSGRSPDLGRHGESDLVLWYPQPARAWSSEALPIGNGRLGGMIFGAIASERVQLNEDSLWTGDDNPSGDYDLMGSYQALADLYVQLPSHAGATEYRRELNIGDAVARVRYQKDGVTYRREYFASFPDQVIVVRLTADQPAAYTGAIELADAHQVDVLADRNRLLAAGSLANGLAYETQVLAVNDGGSVDAAGGRIAFADCDALTLLIAAGTDYVMDFEQGWRGELPHERVTELLEAAAGRSFQDLKNRHVGDYRALFDRVRLTIGPAPDPPSGAQSDWSNGRGDDPARAALSGPPTDQRLQAYKDGASDPFLESLFFQYGRYLLVASSRPGGLPANLQGLWNDSNNPPWHSDYHTNINIQMNYWPAEPANLAECHEPLLNMIQSLREPSRLVTAEAPEFQTPHGPVRGWTARTSHNIYGGHGWKWNNPSNAWYARHVWEHFAFGQDLDYLREVAYPILKEASEFWEDYLKERPDGLLVAPKGWSPEHGPVEDGVSYDQELVWDLFTSYVAAARVLHVDREYRETIAGLRDRLVWPQIGRWGQLQEWMVDRDDPNDQHRHVSHLVGLYPGRQISRSATPELAEAARVSLEARGEGAPGWSQAWKISLWARLLDGDQAHRLLSDQLKQSTMANLLDTHPPFQIDGNFGATAGVCEMLVQSHLDEIVLLPALPGAWPDGSVRGLRARGGFEVEIAWRQGQLAAAGIRARTGGVCTVRYGDQSINLQVAPGETIRLGADLRVRR